MSAYEDLMAHDRTTQALASVAGRTGWDQETVMPAGAAELRSEEMAALEAVLHARRTDGRIGDWLSKAEAPDETGAATLRELKRSYMRNTKVPEKLATDIARHTSAGQGIWAKARAEDDFESFAPTLSRMIDLKREEAACLAGGGDLYDALLDDYEPGMTGAELQGLFDRMRPRLVDLRARVLAAKAPAPLEHTFDEAGQMALSAKLAETFGYDLSRGRIDKAVHPFSSGSGTDVRITTRTSPRDPFNCFYSTIHEVGHACYEQGVRADYALTPLGAGVSMGVHESQSRIYENQLGRSRAFTGWLYGQMRDQFGDFGVADEEAFYAVVNRVGSGYIRTEADEVHYNLHVMLRFDLERQLISGALDVADLEDAWNARFEADFGVSVDKPSNGVLQDVHWSFGLFGYFPTYSLGNVYAGCLYASLRGAVPSLDQDLSRGDTSAATAWLKDCLQQYGGLRAPRDTIEYACGFVPTEEPLLAYLEDKFGTLYGV
ncbi:carboxypeptidase Taq [Litoreibacter ascidiaceicola]|uniref:Metal-dependent carboxypeptidase n=1 Tax=Litoreibacter ascidiaceicola TaxID=1486859 RepID=A0A1M4VZF0_9RHOB|nr:carboxypeptidase M32 [Litoreibacter ascidiaceicola]SHE74092.1 carboxypeptidase Taq [Litoreibacter ascidiaceicola]